MLLDSDDDIVVQGGQKGEVRMQAVDVPAPLREHLGAEATDGLLAILERTRDESVAAAMTACTERFERRLVEMTSAMQVEMRAGFSALREEMHTGLAALRQEMYTGFAALRHEIQEGDAALRQEMQEGDAALRQEMQKGDAALRQEMRDGDAALRLEMRGGDAVLKLEMRDGVAAFRQELANQRAEQLKWSFLFWIGQVAVVAGLFGVLLRSLS